MFLILRQIAFTCTIIINLTLLSILFAYEYRLLLSFFQRWPLAPILRHRNNFATPKNRLVSRCRYLLGRPCPAAWALIFELVHRGRGRFQHSVNSHVEYTFLTIFLKFESSGLPPWLIRRSPSSNTRLPQVLCYPLLCTIHFLLIKY